MVLTGPPGTAVTEVITVAEPVTTMRSSGTPQTLFALMAPPREMQLLPPRKLALPRRMQANASLRLVATQVAALILKKKFRSNTVTLKLA